MMTKACRLGLWLSREVLKTVFKLRISLRWWVILWVVHDASSWVYLPAGDASHAFFLWHIQEEIAISGRLINEGLSVVEDIAVALCYGFSWVYHFGPHFKLLL